MLVLNVYDCTLVSVLFCVNLIISVGFKTYKSMFIKPKKLVKP